MPITTDRYDADLALTRTLNTSQRNLEWVGQQDRLLEAHRIRAQVIAALIDMLHHDIRDHIDKDYR